MQRVRRRRRDLVIELGGRDAHRRERRKIVAVDQVVRDARMVRLRFCLFVKDRGGFQLRGIVLVIEVDCAVERECVKDRRSESSG